MEKPVRIIENEKIKTFNDKVRHGLEHALNFMLGVEEKNKVQISHFEPFLMPIETYLSVYKKKSIMIKLHSTKAFTGELYWFFELKSAIVLGSMLRLLLANALEEKLAKMQFDDMDSDSFGEVGNQLSGILDRAFRTLTAKDIHIRMDFNKKVYPDESIQLANFVNKEEYVVLLCALTIPGRGTEKVTLLLPRSLYEVLLNLEIRLEGITPKEVLVHSWNEEKVENLQTAMNSRYIRVVPAPTKDDIINKLDPKTMACVGIDLGEIATPISLQDSIFLKRLAANRNLQRIPYFLTCKDVDPIVLMEVEKLGLKMQMKSLEKDFQKWAQLILKEEKKKE